MKEWWTSDLADMGTVRAKSAQSEFGPYFGCYSFHKPKFLQILFAGDPVFK